MDVVPIKLSLAKLCVQELITLLGILIQENIIKYDLSVNGSRGAN